MLNNNNYCCCAFGGSMIYVLISLLLSFNNNVIVVGTQDYCSSDPYKTNETFMHFTKEASVEEFAIVGKFKGLHCCAKGYRSIEWRKDGQLHPWSETVSQLILDPLSGNQTIYTQEIKGADAGNYTCLLRNDSVVHLHTIQLQVFENIPDDPKITYISQDTAVTLGSELRLFCEAFAGRVELPDAQNEAVWRKVGDNETILDDPRIEQKKTSRENGQTFGTYLFITDVKREDFGEYICKISKPGRTIEQHVSITEKLKVEYLNHNAVPVARLLLCISATGFLILAAIVLNMQYGLPVRVKFKNMLGPIEENDGKSHDVLVLYSEKDAKIALEIMIPMLERKYRYKCDSQLLPHNFNNWYNANNLRKSSNKSRRIIALLSSSSSDLIIDDNWTSNVVYQKIKLLHALNPKLICVALNALPLNENETKNLQGENLKTIMKFVPVLLWNGLLLGNEKFWWSLVLRLPPKRRYDPRELLAVGILTDDSDANSSRLTNFV